MKSKAGGINLSDKAKELLYSIKESRMEVDKYSTLHFDENGNLREYDVYRYCKSVRDMIAKIIEYSKVDVFNVTPGLTQLGSIISKRIDPLERNDLQEQMIECCIRDAQGDIRRMCALLFDFIESMEELEPKH